MTELEPDIRAITAPNPGPMTHKGTNTYLLGRGDVAVIDPGPDDPGHLAAIEAGLGQGERIAAIFCTHSHRDHSPLARVLSARHAVPVQAFGRHDAARRPIMENLGDIGGGEGVDHDFAPDILLADGAVVEGESWALEAVHTPGHLSNHMCFASAGRMFCGDHVMGWSTTLISPPDGDLSDFMASLERCLGRNERVYYPGHGRAVKNPLRLMENLRAHRQARERQILDVLEAGKADIATITARLYADVDARLHGAAARNVLAHIIDLHERGRVAPEGGFSQGAVFGIV